MKNITAIIITCALWLGGCDTQEFDLVALIGPTTVYTVSGSSNFSDSEVITFDDIRDAIEDIEDIDPENVERVDIEVLKVNSFAQSGNQVDEVTVNAMIQFNDESSPRILVSDYTSEVRDNDEDFDDITDLSRDVVDILRDKYEIYVFAILEGRDLPNEGFTIFLEGSSPSGGIINSQITVKIDVSVVTSEELEVPFFMGK